MSNDKSMQSISGNEVETTGIYENEWGREETLNRGDEFPFDPTNGETEWKLVRLSSES
ncbi:hypothetical protein [Paenibacillus agricola]|uniref:YjzC-like protein n=1 Tax=Paenibacillus agricola TaxID=2716264 RepID=A0ABX0JDB2_9BACL|nr:hypothetical protein [Paenibacillus agricola]NHN34424.1 hypothetical protein [Paenibacillus agricola]